MASSSVPPPSSVDSRRHSHSHSDCRDPNEGAEFDAELGSHSSSGVRSYSLSALRDCLLDEKSAVAKRTRAVFLLRQEGSKTAIDALAEGMTVPSVLLAHECAYVLGQCRDPHAIPALTKVLENDQLNPIVRHEAAEALAAISTYTFDKTGNLTDNNNNNNNNTSNDASSSISSPSSPASLASSLLSILKRFANDCHHEVSDTCAIALGRLEWKLENERRAAAGIALDLEAPSLYHSVDPAPAFVGKGLEELRSIYLDDSKSLFERYRAMFSLRNIGTSEAVDVLAEGFSDKNSAVFRHEIAYVMGQMQHPASIEALKKVLINKGEHAMVRHEAAEALGSIASIVDDSDDETEDGGKKEKQCLPVLEKFQHDDDDIVRESCDVALDINQYWTTDAFDTAEKPNADDAESERKEKSVHGHHPTK